MEAQHVAGGAGRAAEVPARRRCRCRWRWRWRWRSALGSSRARCRPGPAACCAAPWQLGRMGMASYPTPATPHEARGNLELGWKEVRVESGPGRSPHLPTNRGAASGRHPARPRPPAGNPARRLASAAPAFSPAPCPASRGHLGRALPPGRPPALHLSGTARRPADTSSVSVTSHHVPPTSPPHPQPHPRPPVTPVSRGPFTPWEIC